MIVESFTRSPRGISNGGPRFEIPSSHRHFVAISGSGAIGRHPLDRTTWSGSSYSFFSILQERGRLARAFGVNLPAIQRWRLMLANFDVDRRTWRNRFYTDCRYREALTRLVRPALRSEDLEGDIIQLGALFNAAEALEGRTACYLYMDGNVAELAQSPYAVRLPAQHIDRAIAFERRVYQSMTRIYVAGTYLRESLMKNFDVPAERIFVLGMGVNLDPLPVPPAGKAYDTREVLFIGEDFQRKGGFDLLRAFKAVRERMSDATLHIVGPRKLAIPAELAAGVQYHGHLRKGVPAEWQRLEGLLRRASLFVLPSRYEPFGIAPLEAMLYEVPCVVTNIQALKEMVRPGVTGELVEPGGADALAEVITRLLKDPALLQKMGMTGRLQVLEKYTWPRVVDRFLGTM